MLPYRVLAEANEEVDRAAAYYEQRTPGSGRRFLSEYFDTRDYACATPSAGTRRPERTGHEVREFRFDRFQHKLVAVVHESELVVVAVAHNSRRPGYWLRRLKSL